jgi:hypothetical protein
MKVVGWLRARARVLPVRDLDTVLISTVRVGLRQTIVR